MNSVACNKFRVNLSFSSTHRRDNLGSVFITSSEGEGEVEKEDDIRYIKATE
jgi:hypothetical protein